MGFEKPARGVVFAEKDLENSFLSLADASPLKKSIRRAIINIKENAFCGENIRKKQIPKEYIKKYKIENLWWYPLSDSWRLVYSVVTPSNVELIAVIIDYYSHKEYERKFNY